MKSIYCFMSTSEQYHKKILQLEHNNYACSKRSVKQKSLHTDFQSTLVHSFVNLVSYKFGMNHC